VEARTDLFQLAFPSHVKSFFQSFRAARADLKSVSPFLFPPYGKKGNEHYLFMVVISGKSRIIDHRLTQSSAGSGLFGKMVRVSAKDGNMNPENCFL